MNKPITSAPANLLGPWDYFPPIASYSEGIAFVIYPANTSEPLAGVLKRYGDEEIACCMAAGPDLLAALREWIDIWDGVEMIEGKVTRGRAAIAKATGAAHGLALPTPTEGRQREAIIRAAVAAMPNCNPGVADDLLEGHSMHIEADDLAAVWQAAAGVRARDGGQKK
jgi:hypothetical protein